MAFKNRRSGSQGFTLIELLVVISIIALLSSVVLSSLNSARAKASLSASQQFAANVYHAAGDEAVGIWEFNECSGSTVNDVSGNGNDAVLTGGASFSSDTATGKGCSLSAVGTGWADAGAGASLSVISRDLTVMGWVKVLGVTSYNYLFSNDRDCCGSYNGYSLQVASSNRAVFRMWNSSAVAATGATTLQVGQWYHLAATYDGSTMKVYVNGKLDGSLAYSGNLGNPASFNSALGALGACTGGCARNLLVDSVHVFAKTLVASDIEGAYSQAVSTRPFARR